MRRRLLTAALLPLALAACGGGGGGGGGGGEAPPQAGAERFRTLNIASRHTGVTYVMDVYVPTGAATRPPDLPVIVALDGPSWFATLVDIVSARPSQAIVVALHTMGQRSHDFVPVNGCTSGGGGEGRYLDFIRLELLPFIATNIGGDPQQRILFGHSHGGSFVLNALFADAPGQHPFKAYLASDASIGCMPSTVYGWEQRYAAAHATLPVRLHLSYASQGNHAANAAFATALKQRAYGGLALAEQLYVGGHSAIVPQALGDGVAFALATGR